MPNIAVFPGSFDPFTLGHQEMVDRAVPLFDQVIIAIGINSQKQYLFPLEQRKSWIAQLYETEDRITVQTYEGLTVDFCQSVGARYIIRGLRTGIDLAYEQPIAQMNKKMKGIETIFLVSSPEFSVISSTIVRDIIRHGGDASQFLPAGIRID